MKNKNLHNITSSGFKTPKDYFNTFEDEFFNKLNSEEKVFDIKSSGYKTPQDYFDNLEDRIINNLSKTKETPVISLLNKKTVIFISSIAAAALLIFNLSIFKSQPSFESLQTETVENFIIVDDISSYEIASLISDGQIDESEFVDHNLDKENIEEYLLEHSDIESLMIE